MGIATWLCLFFESSKVLCFSKREDDAWDLIAKAKFIVERLPDFLRLKLDPNQRAMLGFPATNSSIKAYPSTEDAGRSTDATLVIADEWEFHPYAEANFAAVKPTVDAGGSFIGISTVDKQNLKTFAKKVWHKAVAKENNFTPLFYGWKVVPTRTQEWFDTVTRDLEPWQREQEYPSSIEEALRTPQTICRFDMEALSAMRAECPSPIDIRRNGLVKIYRKFVAGRKYVLVVDNSEGDYDPTAGIIVDVGTLEEVVCVHGKISINEQAVIFYELYEEYHSPYTAVERNASGLTLIGKLKDMGLENWHYYDKSKNKEGWWTGVNRGNMISDLAEGIFTRQYRIYTPEAIDEFKTFIKPEKRPDGEARGGCHDDFVMAWAIAGQIRKYVPMGEMTVSHSQYRD